MLHMISNVAEPSRKSEWYPFTRTKDWYDGHSWASGIFAFPFGKNQESTSESVNGWYAIYLYGLVTENTRLKDLGRLLTALEIRASSSYWHMTTESSNFPAHFSNNKAVGIQWSTKVDYQTWFGANVEYIHCIQVLDTFWPGSNTAASRCFLSPQSVRNCCLGHGSRRSTLSLPSQNILL